MPYKNVDPLYVELGARIKAARKLKGMSQQELAKVLGLHRVSVANIEAGRQKVMFHQVLVLVQVLGLSLDFPQVDEERAEEIKLKAKQARYAKRIRRARKRIEVEQERLDRLEKLVKE